MATPMTHPATCILHMASSASLFARYSFVHGKSLVRAIGVNAAGLRNYSQETTHVPTAENMSFEEYRKLRKALKWRGRFAGIPLGLLAVTASSTASAHFLPDMFNPQPEVEIQPILGMDPMIFAVLCSATSGIVGIALGGVIFSSTWQFMFSSSAKLLQEREDDFLARLQKHRYSNVDQNAYEDDYYAEKVMTLADYRQWIRQQQIKKQNKRRS